MSLLEYYRSSATSLEHKTIDQIVAFAGEGGKLTDNSAAQEELRTLFRELEIEEIITYSKQCLDNPFQDSGLVFQDLVNEMGARLNFKVTNGDYQGRVNRPGYDGIWTSNEGHSFIVESKVDANFPISLDTTGKYRKELIQERQIEEDSSILYIVGRGDKTLALERQIRGSEYAQTTRILGLEALIKLLRIYQESISDTVSSKIYEILKPADYTKVDRIVDIVFTASEDHQSLRELEAELDDQLEHNLTKHEAYSRKRQLIATKLVAHLGNVPALIKRKTSLFSDSTGKFKIAVSVSKRYSRADQQYWYAYLEPMRDYLREADNGLMVYGFVDKDFAVAIPFQVIEEYRNQMQSTPSKGNRSEYWHVSIRENDGSVNLNLPKSRVSASLDDYKFDIS